MPYMTEAHEYSASSGVESFLIIFDRLSAACTTTPGEHDAWVSSSEHSLPESLILQNTQSIENNKDFKSSYMVVGLKTL